MKRAFRSTYLKPAVIVLGPLFVGAVLVLSALQVVSEQQSPSPLDLAESFLLRPIVALFDPAVPKSQSKHAKVVTVTFSDRSLPFVERAPQPLLFEAHISVYAQTLKTVLQAKPRFVYISPLVLRLS